MTNARGYDSFDWSGDEVLFGLFAAGTAVATLGPLAVAAVSVRTFGRGRGGRRLVAGGAAVGIAASLPVLLWWADPVHVVGHLDYALLFMVGAAAWVGVVGQLGLPCLGLSVRDDVIERANPAAAVVAAAALLAAGLIYALSNIGRGDTIWTTLLPAAAATAAWGMLWLLLATTTGAADRVAIDRDTAAAARLAAYLVSSAAILGAATAGDFGGYGPAAEDLARLGWPAGVAWLLAAAEERRHRPTPARPVGRLPADAVPTVASHVALAAAALAWRVHRG